LPAEWIATHLPGVVVNHVATIIAALPLEKAATELRDINPPDDSCGAA
jgi:hypothetical protein